MAKKRKKKYVAPKLMISMLRRRACTDAGEEFRRRFGDGGTVTLRRCLAVARDAGSSLSFDWAAVHLLCGAQDDVYTDDAQVGKAQARVSATSYWSPGFNGAQTRLRVAKARAFFKAWHTDPGL